MNADPKELLTNESLRIEEDAEHSMKGHYNAADFQNKMHLILGLPAAVFAAVAGGTALGDQAALTSSLAFMTAMLAGAITFLKPSEKAEQHKSSASRYHSLRNNVRRFREIEVPTNQDFGSLKTKLDEFAESLNELNEICPQIPHACSLKAKKDIDAGRANYRVDEKDNDS